MKCTKLVLSILLVFINFALCSNLQYSTENEIENEIAAADCKCKNGFCEKDKNGKLVCKCPSDYGLWKSECYKCECGDGSTCTFSGFFNDIKKCICKKGYSDVDGRCKGDCKKNPCKNGGACRVVGNDITCDCVSPYSGENCTEDLCRSNPCKNGGVCKVYNGWVNCTCKDPYFGRLCDRDLCKPNPCKNDGVCKGISGSVSCTCKDPYSGKFCETDLCMSNPCKNGGVCKVLSGKVNCTCKDPSSGNFCETYLCKSHPCKNGGLCKVLNGKVNCTCKDPYSGDLCETDISSSTQIFSRTVSRSTPLSSTTTTYANDTEPPETTTYITNTAILSSTSTSHETIFTSGKASTSVEDTNSTIHLEINSTVTLDINLTEILSTSSTVNFTIATGKTSTTGNNTERTASDEGSLTSTLTTESEQHITMVDWCASNPCQNGGYCRNRMDTFQCMCTGIYGGKDCSENIFCELYGEDLCGREICQYNDRIRRGYCVCKDGKVFNKASKTCIGSCSNYFCLNGGICKEKDEIPRCYCRTPFNGERCEKDPCTPNPCQNAASCSVDGTTYKCLCKDLYVGTNCEYDWRYIMAAVLLLVLLSSIVFCRGCHVYKPTQTLILSGSDGYKNLHNIP